jgi:uncharacterized membrane protein YdjX (TVP38/TMEM64 family)
MSRNRLVIVAALAGIAVLVALTLPIQTFLTRFLEWVDGLGAWGPGLVAAAYVPATVFFVPGSLLTLGAGALFGVVVGTVVVSLGSTLGSTAAFVVGRFFARDWVARKVAGNARFAALDAAVGEQGFKIVLLSRLSPAFPYNMLGYMYGITNVKLRDYVVATWIGMLPGTVLYVYLGALAGSVAKAAAGDAPRAEDTDTLRWIFYGVGLLATIAVTVVVTRVAAKAMREAAPDVAPALAPPATSDSPEAG